MSQRNSFFAVTFTRELDRWKKGNRKSQEDFAEAIGKGPNMITRYKSGKDFPSEDTLAEICRVLQVDQSIFYPKTFDEKLKYDSAFQARVKQTLEEMEAEELSANGIDLLFWEFLWRTMPDLKGLMPSAVMGKKKGFLFQKEIDGEIVFFDQEDLDFVFSLQKGISGYIRREVIQYALYHHLDGTHGPDHWESIPGQLEPIYDLITRELLRENRDTDPG